MNKANPFSKFGQLSTGILQEQAASYLASGSYKMTQEIYKILLKREENPRFRQGLADCYLHRALLAAEQGKFKDAVTFWGNYHQQSDGHESNQHYVVWLLKAGQVAKIKSYLLKLGSQELDKDYPEIALTLGFNHVAGLLDLLQFIPPNSALAEQTIAVNLALQALQHNDFVAMQQALAKIPFRSVYRDCRTLLKAAVLSTSEPQQCQELLKKIEAHSPYFDMAALVEMLSKSGRSLTDALVPLSSKHQNIICKAKNWTVQQIKLLQYISRQKQKIQNKAQFELAIQYQGLLGSEYARRFCLALLPEYTAGKRSFEKSFGKLDEFEAIRVRALSKETKGEFYDAMDDWDDCIELLQADQANSLKIAMIYRHMSNNLPVKEGLEYRMKSLQYDKNDRTTHERILADYEALGLKAEYKQQFETMLVLFPDDITILDKAMQQAIDKNAFKKATTYAKKILNVDPVNTRAKQTLFDSHLNHARKLLKTEKYHLVENEIVQAEKLALGKDYPAQAAMLLSFFVYLSDDTTKGSVLLVQSINQFPHRQFINQIRAFIHAKFLGLPKTVFKGMIPHLPDHYQLASSELIDILSLIAKQQTENRLLATESLDFFKKDLKRLIQQQDFSDAELLTIMQGLDRIKHFDLMRHCLKGSHDKKLPAWSFYRIYIQAKGSARNINSADFFKLEALMESAKEMGEPQSIKLISDFIDKIIDSRNNLVPEIQEVEEYSPYDILFDRLDNRTYNKIINKFDDLRVNTSEDKLNKLILDIAGDYSRRDILMTDPDSFFSIMFLLSAQQLNIDIGISVDDILAIASQQRSSTFSFPF